MTAFVTGGGGFIGRRLVRRLQGAGTPVRALTRSDASAASLREAGCDVVIGDALDGSMLERAMDGCDVVYHVAGDYRVGIRASMRAVMEAANVTATERVLDAAIAAGVGRIVHVSTINAFGDTGYRVVDESYERPVPYRYVSFYDETKHRSHLAAHARMDGGAPVLIAMPGGVYGAGDHTSLGSVLEQAAHGRLPTLTFGDLGLNMAHVDDIAAGIALVGERGTPGRSYVLGGEITTMGELVRRVAAIGHRRPPRLSTPTWALRAAAPLVRRIGPDLGEMVRAGAGVTYWASDARARRELGYAPRDLESGLTAVFGRG
ncbi:MAG TPA: NAD-dependent epimerase/dehydratase family protein [Candidatus Limnocylindria bacterium]|nr:NAD-dependent epimerase/dehydratase family protein [Candidatus Limnocylindria bacterium]